MLTRNPVGVCHSFTFSKLFHSIFHFAFLVFFCVPQSASAQPDAPVMGDIFTLLDLLKKDYQTIAPDLRDEAIANDRRLVIGIFSGYMSDAQSSSFIFLGPVQTGNYLRKSAETLEQYNKKKQLFGDLGSSYVAAKVKTSGLQDYPIQAYIDATDDILESLATAKINYYDALFKSDINQLEVIKSRYSNNTFISLIIQKFIKKFELLQTKQLDYFAANNHKNELQKGIPFVGGDLNFSTFIDGLGLFLAERIKEELTNNVIGQLRKQFDSPPENSPIPELKILLPRTTEYIIKFKADQVTNFTNEIRQYIQDDLNNLAANAVNLKNAPSVKKLLKKEPDLVFVFEGIELINHLTKIKSPADYFNILESDDFVTNLKTSKDADNQLFADFISITSLIAQSFLILEDGQVKFSGINQLKRYSSETDFYQLYIGLIYQQSIKYHHVTGFERGLNTLMSSVAVINFKQNTDFLANILSKIGSEAEKVNALALDIRKAKKSGIKISADTIYQFINSNLDFTQTFILSGMGIYAHLGMDTSHFSVVKQKMNIYLEAGRKISSVTKDLMQKKYAIAIFKMLELIPESVIKPTTLLLKDIEKVQDINQLSDWSYIIQTLLNSGASGSITIDNNLIKKCENIRADADSIQSHIFTNIGMSNNDIMNLTSTITNIANSSAGTTITIPGVLSLQNFLKNTTDFSEEIIYYYTLSQTKKTLESLRFKYNSDAALVSILDAKVNYIFNQIYKNKILNQPFTQDDWQAVYKNLETAINDILKHTIRLSLYDYPSALKIVYFINDLAAASNAEQVADAIDAIALPAGSYAIKRTAKVNVAINAFPGMIAGLEYTRNNGHRYYEGTVVGFTAPVGVSITLGAQKCIFKESSLGIFLPLIDIGAVTRLHFDENKKEPVSPDIKLKDVFSPGVYAHWGFRKTPLSLNAGCQYGPQRVRGYDTWSYNIGLVLDIPIYNLHTKPRF